MLCTRFRMYVCMYVCMCMYVYVCMLYLFYLFIICCEKIRESFSRMRINFLNFQEYQPRVCCCVCEGSSPYVYQLLQLTGLPTIQTTYTYTCQHIFTHETINTICRCMDSIDFNQTLKLHKHLVFNPANKLGL